MQGIAVSETEKEVNAFPATPVTVLINIGACSIDYYRLTKIPWRKPRDLLEILAEKRGRGKIQVVADFGDSFLGGAELRLCIHDDAIQAKACIADYSDLCFTIHPWSIGLQSANGLGDGSNSFPCLYARLAQC